MNQTITSNGHISEEQQTTDERFVGSTWFLLHDINVRCVEAESGGWESVCHQVDPQELYGDQGFGHTQGGGQEDADEEMEGNKLFMES